MLHGVRVEQTAQAVRSDVGRVIRVVGAGVDAGLDPSNMTILWRATQMFWKRADRYVIDQFVGFYSAHL